VLPFLAALLKPALLGPATVAAVSVGQFAFGIAYVASCELRSTGPTQCEQQWLTASALMFGGAGTAMGLNTKNPLLRSAEAPPMAPEPEPMRVPAPRKRRTAREPR
jgi:hypothetical protein